MSDSSCLPFHSRLLHPVGETRPHLGLVAVDGRAVNVPEMHTTWSVRMIAKFPTGLYPTHLYPDLIACLTAAVTSPGLDFHVPRPKRGIACPEESFTVWATDILMIPVAVYQLIYNLQLKRVLITTNVNSKFYNMTLP